MIWRKKALFKKKSYSIIVVFPQPFCPRIKVNGDETSFPENSSLRVKTILCFLVSSGLKLRNPWICSFSNLDIFFSCKSTCLDKNFCVLDKNKFCLRKFPLVTVLLDCSANWKDQKFINGAQNQDEKRLGFFHALFKSKWNKLSIFYRIWDHI